MTPDEFRKRWETATPKNRDAKVARLVMGWMHPWDEGAHMPTYRRWGDCIQIRRYSGDKETPWRPTTVIADAWEVVEAMRADYYWNLSDEGDCWSASCGSDDAEALTAPEAICLAACLAKLTEDN